MKLKYWTVIILGAVAIGVSVVYYVQTKPYDLGPIVVLHEVKKSSILAPPQANSKGLNIFSSNELSIGYPTGWYQCLPANSDANLGLPILELQNEVCGIYFNYSQPFKIITIKSLPSLYEKYSSIEALKSAATTEKGLSDGNQIYIEVDGMSNATLAGQPALKITSCTSVGCGDIENDFFVYWNSSLYEVTYYYGKETGIPSEDMQIINSLKFTN